MIRYPVFFLLFVCLALLWHQQFNHMRQARHSLVDQHRAMEFGVKP